MGWISIVRPPDWQNIVGVVVEWVLGLNYQVSKQYVMPLAKNLQTGLHKGLQKGPKHLSPPAFLPDLLKLLELDKATHLEIPHRCSGGTAHAPAGR